NTAQIITIHLLRSQTIPRPTMVLCLRSNRTSRLWQITSLILSDETHCALPPMIFYLWSMPCVGISLNRTMKVHVSYFIRKGSPVCGPRLWRKLTDGVFIVTI